MVRQWARDGKRFGIVAGTGTGKTLGIRLIAEEILDAPLFVGVVNREREATAKTPEWNVVIITTGIARRWLADDLITRRDTIVVDEIHQTSAELELCLALGKRAGARFIWLSATVDPTVYREYLSSDEVLETSAFDPALRAKVWVTAKQPAEFLDDRTVRRFISARRGVVVFLPTRAEVERLGVELGSRFPKLATAFYHGGEPIRVLRPFLEGDIKKPYLLAMTAAGQSALNLPGLDTVVIYDARYGNVVERGRNVLHRLHLGPNEILQMAGRVHGRVAGGVKGRAVCPWLENAFFLGHDGRVAACCFIKDSPRHGFGLASEPLALLVRQRQALADELAAGRIPPACQGCGTAQRVVSA